MRASRMIARRAGWRYLGPGGGTTPPPDETGITSFSDNFDTANINLDDRTGWTNVTGEVGAASINNNALRTNTTNVSGILYKIPELTSSDCFVQCRHYPSASFVAVRVTDDNNFIGVRRNGSNSLDVFKRVSGTFTQLANYGSLTDSTIMIRLEIVASTFKLFRNGVEQTPSTGSTTITSGPPVTKIIGVVVRNQPADPWIDDFSCGIM